MASAAAAKVCRQHRRAFSQDSPWLIDLCRLQPGKHDGRLQAAVALAITGCWYCITPGHELARRSCREVGTWRTLLASMVIRRRATLGVLLRRRAAADLVMQQAHKP
jgi:hypothetical protein